MNLSNQEVLYICNLSLVNLDKNTVEDWGMNIQCGSPWKAKIYKDTLNIVAFTQHRPMF